MTSGAQADTEGQIAERLREVRVRVSSAAAAVGRDPDGVRIVAVTKGFPASVARAAYNLGLRDFGENRVREGLLKKEEVGSLKAARWHMIGHVQSRKAREVATNFAWVHSVDRMKIADRLSRFVDGPPLPILLQCNVSGEQSKFGWELADDAVWPEVIPQFAELSRHPQLEIRGLMTIAPWTSDKGVVRRTFQRLGALAEFLRQALPGISFAELSMGMSDDYEIAVEEGATLVRLGRAIFGPRP